MSEINTTTIPRDVTFMKAELTVQVPASAEYFDHLVKTPGAAVAGAVSDTLYRGFATFARAGIGKAVAEETKQELAEDSTKPANGKGQKPKESWDTFVNRLVASGVITQTRVQELADAWSLANPFCVWLAESGSSAGGGQISKEHLELADRLLGAWASGSTQPEVFLTKIRAYLPSASLSEAPDQQEVALLLKRFDKAKAAALKAQRDADLGL